MKHGLMEIESPNKGSEVISTSDSVISCRCRFVYNYGKIITVQNVLYIGDDCVTLGRHGPNISDGPEQLYT